MSWIEIFKAGKQTDSAGNVREWTEEELDQVVESYDPEWHEAPVVIGHPADDGPAYGWVEALKRDGKTLLAKLKDLDSGFVELHKARRFAKRSASFYGLKAGGFYLRHLGFLGAAPPAVKGLQEAKFRDGESDAVTYEFDEHRMPIVGRILSGLRDLLIEKFGIETADRAISTWDVEELQRVEEETAAPYTEGPEEGPAVITNHKEEETMTDEERQKIEDAAKAKAEVEFNEQIAAEATAHAEELKGKDEELAALRKEQRTDDIKSFLEPLMREGKVIPAMKEAGIVNFMEHLATHPPLNDQGQEVTVSFAEGKEKQLPSAWFREFLSGLPVQVEFKEVAVETGKSRSGGTGPEGETAEQKLIAFAGKLEKEEKLEYSDAFKRAREEHPELWEAYLEEKAS